VLIEEACKEEVNAFWVVNVLIVPVEAYTANVERVEAFRLLVNNSEVEIVEAAKSYVAMVEAIREDV
jgi:hypothetical protein